MKVLHICLCAALSDKMKYQENTLSKYHAGMGFDTYILTMFHALGPVANQTVRYVNEDNVSIVRLKSKRTNLFNGRLRYFEGITDELRRISPDVIFIHGCQFVDIKKFIRYKKQNPNVKIYIDNHADFINSARGAFSKYILHRIIWRYKAKSIEPYTEKFFGVFPARCDFLHDVYGIKREKIELLVMGADDARINFKDKAAIRAAVRKKLDIAPDDFLIISGGKINKRKNIDMLMSAVRSLDNDKIKLLIFGKPALGMENIISDLSKGRCIRNIGWIESDDVYDYYLASDLAFFPGTHSVLWEQAVGTGLPCVFKKWKGTDHVNVNNNCIISDCASVEELAEIITRIYEDEELYDNMLKNAYDACSEFWYSKIAARIKN